MAAIQPAARSIELTVRMVRCTKGLKIGDSVAINGCCLTVVHLKKQARQALARFDLLQETWERTKKIFNILADKVETVSPWIADRILANQEHGMQIRWLNRGKVLWRFLSASWNKRDLFGED